MLKNTLQNYGSLSKFFHWTIALLIIFMLFLGFLMVGQKILTLHQLTGLTILTLATFRLIWILSNPHPRLPPDVTRFDKVLARSVQGLLYVCMFGMPLSGWAMSTAFGFNPHIGNFYLPMPGIPNDQSLGLIIKNIHNTMALVLIGLIALHIAGALKHYFIDKDGVLESMLPRFKK